MRVSPQKARLVIDLIRGLKAGDALNILRSTNKRSAPAIEKVLRSAISNAENKSKDVDVDNLVVSEAYVNEGPRAKRIRPAPMGRAFRYQRRMAHIAITLGEKAGSARVAGAAPPAGKAKGHKPAAKKTSVAKKAAKK